MTFLHGLALALRALRWRARTSLVVLVVAVLASAAAALGPLYASSAQDSLVRDRLGTADLFTRSVTVSADLAVQPDLSAQTVSAVEQAAGDPRLDTFFGPAREILETGTASAELAVGGRARGYAGVGWRSSMCTSVRFTAGRCPTGPREIAVSRQTVADAGLHLGQSVFLGLTDPAADRVVGVYDRVSARGPAFALSSPTQAAPPAPGTTLPRLDLVLASRPTLARDLGVLRITDYRVLRPGVVHAGDLGTLASLLAATAADQQILRRPQYTAMSPLTALIAGLARDRRQVRDSSLAVTAQLVVLSWFVLFLVVAATTEERSGEVALAKLRGSRVGATTVFVLAEPLLLLVVAAPAGLFLALAADLALTRSGLGAGTAVGVDGGALEALGAAFVGGLAACALAARRVLTVPVLAELRRTGGRRARVARTVAVDAVVVAAAAAGVGELTEGTAGPLVLLVPGLLSLAVGVPAARLVAPVAALEVRRTRRSRDVAAFLAARNLARRPGSARSVVLLTVALALAVFAVDGWSAAAGTRDHQARQQVGAPTVLHTAFRAPTPFLDAVRRADPGGHEAMAAIQSDPGANGALLAVDASRFGAVTSWNPAWAGTSMSRLVSGLAPAAVPALSLHGPQVLVGTDDEPPPTAVVAWTLTLRVLGSDGVQSDVDLGPTGTGPHSLTATLPEDCDRAPCALLSITLNRPLRAQAPAAGSFTVRFLRDSRGPVGPAGRTGAHPGAGTARWRVAISALGQVDPTRPRDAVLDGGRAGVGFTATFTDSAVGDVDFDTTAYPVAVPVLQGRRTPAEPYGGLAGVVYAAGLGPGPVLARVLPGAGPLPRIGDDGSMVDLGLLAPQDLDTPAAVDEQVWLAPGASAHIRSRLAAEGLQVISVETVADRTTALDRDGSTLALRLFLVAAAAAVALAAAAVLSGLLVGARRRSYEVAAVLALGGSRRALVAAGRREQLAVTGFGALLGVAAGAGAVRLVLPRVSSITGGSGPLAAPAVQGGALLATVVVTVAVVGLLVQVGAHRVVRLASADRLREVQP